MKTEPSHYLCLSWISEERLVLGTYSGKVQLFDVGELKNEFNVFAKTGSSIQSPADTSRKTM